nr:MAG TPA: hypothetical protein [Caudoviricetes sp.]
MLTTLSRTHTVLHPPFCICAGSRYLLLPLLRSGGGCCLPGIKPCCMTLWACGPATWYRRMVLVGWRWRPYSSSCIIGC